MGLETNQFQFGRFKLDAANSLLLDGQKPIRLPPKAFDTLVYLVKNSHRLVTRDELMKALWPDSFVEEANLTVNISLVRRALGEKEGDQAYIETVPRRGYRFNTEVKLLEETVDSSRIALQPPRTTTHMISVEEPGVDSTGHGGRRRDAMARLPAMHEVITFLEPRKASEQESSVPTGSLPRASQPRPEPTLDQEVKHPWLLAGAIALVVISVLAGWFSWRPSRHAVQVHQRRLTSFAPEMAVMAVAISTGAKFVAYANPIGLFIQVIATGETHSLQLPEPDFQVSSISWFPDSAELLVDGASPRDDSPSLWIVPVIGNNRPIKLGPYPPGAVSPDGSEIAWVNSRGAAPEIQVMPTEGGAIQTAVTGAGDEVFGSVSWRRRGRALLFTRYSWNPQLRRNSGSIDIYDLRSGKTVMFLSGDDFGGDAVSLPDGRVIYSKIVGANPSAYGGELLAARTDPQTGTSTGSPLLIARWDAPVTDLTVNASGTRLALRDWDVQHSVYMGELTDGGTKLVSVRRFTFGVGREDFPRAWTPDSKAIFLDSNRSGHWEIFKQALDSDSDQPFVQGPDDQFTPRLSPDGAWLLYIDRPKDWHEPQPASLMRVPISGGTPQLVLKTSDFSEWGLRFECPRRAGMPCVLAQRQGSQIAFRTFDTFDPEQGFQRDSKELARTDYVPDSQFDWCLAPDGLSIAWIKRDPTDNRIHLLPLARTASGLTSRANEREIAISGGAYLHSITWSPDGKGWFIVRELPASWTLLYADAEGKTSTLLTTPSTFAPDTFPSPNSERLAFSEQGFTSNVWLLEHF